MLESNEIGFSILNFIAIAIQVFTVNRKIKRMQATLICIKFFRCEVENAIQTTVIIHFFCNILLFSIHD